MLRKTFNWLLLALPAGWIVGLGFSVWLSIEGMAAFYEWQFGLPGVREQFLEVRDRIAIGACAAFGFYRVVGLHPLFSADYRWWLSFTPWRRGLPLPIGPVHLAPQDGVVLAAIVLALHDAQLPRLAAPAAFLSAYLAALLLSFATVGFRRVSYALAYGLGLVAWLGLLSPEGFGLLALLVVGSQFALSRSLDEFPWPGRAMRQKELQGKLLVASAGWPFAQMQPSEPEIRIGYRDGMLLSLLAGWWTFALSSVITNAEAREFFETVIQYALPLAIAGVRIGVYLPSHRSPINPLGRLLTLRLLIPGYDRVFAASLCIVLTAAFAPTAIDDLSAWLGVALPTPHLILALSLLEALSLGPTLKDWRLASPCRIVPGMLNSQEFIDL